MSSRQNLLVEQVMGDLKKVDCISIENALKEIGVTRNTLNSYLNALGVPKHKFPFDKRVYVTKVDFERVKQFVEENRQ